MTFTPPQKSRIDRSSANPSHTAKIIWHGGVNGVAPVANSPDAAWPGQKNNLPIGNTRRNEIALAKPPRDPRHSLTHLVGRAGVGETNEGAAMDRIEVDARRCRDMRLLQHAAGKFETVRGEIGNIGVEVERAISGKELGEACLRQPLDQDATVLLIAALDRLHLGCA